MSLPTSSISTLTPVGMLLTSVRTTPLRTCLLPWIQLTLFFTSTTIFCIMVIVLLPMLPSQPTPSTLLFYIAAHHIQSYLTWGQWPTSFLQIDNNSWPLMSFPTIGTSFSYINAKFPALSVSSQSSNTTPPSNNSGTMAIKQIVFF